MRILMISPEGPPLSRATVLVDVLEALPRELRARGHDVVSVHEEPGSGTADEEVFDYARSERRAVVTENVREPVDAEIWL